MILRPLLKLAGVLALGGILRAHAESAPFDLIGPTLEVRVTRGSQTLPIAQVPNLSEGDRLALKADLPATQSAHYLLVAAFLSGSTNPPPQSWFYRCETWKKCGQAGLELTVPQGAQQVLVFLAPATGGDFHTLIGAVRGRPGAFVRTSQDLNQATLDRSRLESYLSSIRALDREDPARLKEAAPLLARSLAIKVDPKCLDRIPALQAPCLMQGQESLILDDGHSTSMVEALTSGPASDLAMQASYTPQLSYGYYSPYIASVMDIARIMGSIHTAQYQYIPALASLQGARMVLTLNTPPSFHNPMSVLVAALPAVERAQLPPLHAVDPKEMYCARKSSLVLPVEGAPLVFSTEYAHDVKLTLSGEGGAGFELPARADAERGGFVVDTSGLGGAKLGDRISATLHGRWGFEQYSGPSFQLINAHTQNWTLAARDASGLIVGREDTIHLEAASVSCIDGIMFRDPAGKELKPEWKEVKPDEIEVKVPLQETQPGSVTLLVRQYGATDPQPVTLEAFAEAGHLDSFSLHAGDAQGVLKGSRLDEVATLTLKGIAFTPGTLASGAGGDELPMAAQDAQAADALKAGEAATAKVLLKDGRSFNLKVTVAAARPSAVLIGKSVQPSASSADSNIRLGNPEELPQDAQVTFSVRARQPAAFAHDEAIEVATADEGFSTLLTVANGGITLEDSEVAVVRLDPAKAFGSSAFGPLRFRVIIGGSQGDWQPLGTLVRLPLLRDLSCPATPELACRLSGTNLFLVDSVSSDEHFEHPVRIPDGFPGYALPVPHPSGGQLYVRLRDDPAVINIAALSAQQLPPSPEEAERAQARHEAATPEAPAGGTGSVNTPPAPGSPEHPAEKGKADATAPGPAALPPPSAAVAAPPENATTAAGRP